LTPNGRGKKSIQKPEVKSFKGVFGRKGGREESQENFVLGPEWAEWKLAKRERGRQLKKSRGEGLEEAGGQTFGY